MKRLVSLAVVLVFIASAGLAQDGTAGGFNDHAVEPIQGRPLADIILSMLNPLETNAVVTLCDSLGLTWTLDITGSTVTGSVDVCPTPWPVVGTLTSGPGCPAAKLDLFADGTLANCGFCNSAIHMSGAVDLGSKTLDAYHDQQAGCAGTVVVSAGLCP